MQKSKITVVSNVMLNIHPGNEVDAIIDGDTVYVPALTIPQLNVVSEDKPSAPEIAPKPSAPIKEEAPKSAAPKEEVAEEEAAQETTSLKHYSEKELKELSVDDLKEICEKLGVDVDAAAEESGAKRITNKFVRELILEAQSSGAVAQEAEDVQEEAAAEKEVDYKNEALGILTALENEEISDAQAQEDLIKLVTDNFDLSKEELKQTKADIKEFVIDEFFENEDRPIDEIADDFALIAIGEFDPGEEAEEESAEAESTDYDSMEAVDPKSLKKGDKVAVFWNLEEDGGWFLGEVTAKPRGKGPEITYEDGETDGVNKVTTKFVLLD